MIIKDKTGCYFNGEKITVEKYNEILAMLRSSPDAPEGYACRLTDNLEWELYEAPIIEAEEEELSEEEALDIILGGTL